MELLKIDKITRGGVTVNISEIARRLGCSWSTARNKLYSKEKQIIIKSSILDDYKDIIIDKIDNYSCTAFSVFSFIKERGYIGSYETVKKFVREYKKEQTNKAVLRILSTPAVQAQVDWKESMKLLTKDGKEIEFNIFLYVLSYSKFKYLELTTDRTQITLFKCLINAFKYCNNSIPKEIWFDNMKTVVKEHNIKTGVTVFNESFLVFSKDIGFTPIACRPYRPQTKGIVENVAKIMDRLKVYNKEINDINDIKDLVNDLNIKLNNEISQATNDKPINLFEKEKEYLLPIGNKDLLTNYESRQTRKVSIESLITFSGCKYSLPTEYIGKTVEIEFNSKKLSVYYNKNLVTCHEITNKIYNYHREHLIAIMKSDVYKNKDDDYIKKAADERLQSYDKLGKVGE